MTTEALIAHREPQCLRRGLVLGPIGLRPIRASDCSALGSAPSAVTISANTAQASLAHAPAPAREMGRPQREGPATRPVRAVEPSPSWRNTCSSSRFVTRSVPTEPLSPLVEANPRAIPSSRPTYSPAVYGCSKCDGRHEPLLHTRPAKKLARANGAGFGIAIAL